MSARDRFVVEARVALNEGSFVLLFAGVPRDVDGVAVICEAATGAMVLA